MTLTAVPGSASRRTPGESRKSRRSFLYRLYGRLVQSDIELPICTVVTHKDETVAWEIVARHEEPFPAPDGPVVAAFRVPDTFVDATVWRGPAGTWIRNAGVGMFHISPDARRVVVDIDATADPTHLAILLTGQIPAIIFRRLGRPMLHASAVVTPQGAIAFLGTAGYGKSTMAACFIRRGALLLADDGLPLRDDGEAIWAGPGIASMRLWPDSVAAALEHHGELPNVITGFDKKLIAFGPDGPFASGAAPLRRIYVLGRYSAAKHGRQDCYLESIAPRDSVTILLAQTSWAELFQPADAAPLLSLYARLAVQAPLAVLRYPSDYRSQPDAYNALIADLDRR